MRLAKSAGEFGAMSSVHDSGFAQRADCVLRRVYNERSIGGFAMIRGLIAGALLLLGSVSSEAQTTVKEFTTSMGNPEKRGVAELYAIGVGHGFFWYQVMMAAQSRAGMRAVEMPLICLRENTPFTEGIILDAAKRVMETAKGDDTFEPKLLTALMEMFPCR